MISVLTTDGSTRTGVFLRATGSSLILSGGSDSDVSIPRLDVIRVDLIRASGRGQSIARNAAAGAAAAAVSAGVGLALIAYLHSGDIWIPPARVWGVSAVLGAGYGAAGAMMNQQEESRARTIYIARMEGM